MSVDLMDLRVPAFTRHDVTLQLKDQPIFVRESSLVNGSHGFDEDRDDKSAPSDLDDSDPSVGTKSDAQKREAQRAAFNEYVQIQDRTDKAEAANGVDSSVGSLEVQSNYIIDKARDYQQELFERAKKENVIAVHVPSPPLRTAY